MTFPICISIYALPGAYESGGHENSLIIRIDVITVKHVAERREKRIDEQLKIGGR